MESKLTNNFKRKQANSTSVIHNKESTGYEILDKLSTFFQRVCRLQPIIWHGKFFPVFWCSVPSSLPSSFQKLPQTTHGTYQLCKVFQAWHPRQSHLHNPATLSSNQATWVSSSFSSSPADDGGRGSFSSAFPHFLDNGFPNGPRFPSKGLLSNVLNCPPWGTGPTRLLCDILKTLRMWVVTILGDSSWQHVPWEIQWLKAFHVGKLRRNTSFNMVVGQIESFKPCEIPNRIRYPSSETVAWNQWFWAHSINPR